MIKKTILTFIFIALLISILNVTAFAYTGAAFVATDSLAVFDGPSWDCIWIDSLARWTNVNIDEDAGYGWYKISYNGKTGYVAGYYLLFGSVEIAKEEPIEEKIEMAAPPPPATTTETPTNSVSRQDIINTAKQYLGVSYRWGGESVESGFDCSGLIYIVYKQHDIKIHRIAQDMLQDGKEVSLDNLKLGDILFFGDSIYNIRHVGLYTGDGLMIHSSWGETVKIDRISDIQGMSLITARRII